VNPRRFCRHSAANPGHTPEQNTAGRIDDDDKEPNNAVRRIAEKKGFLKE